MKTFSETTDFVGGNYKFNFVQSFFCKIQLNTYTLNNSAILNFRQQFSDILIYSLYVLYPVVLSHSG